MYSAEYPPDHAELESALEFCECDAAELHGLLCGLICVVGPLAHDPWLAHAFLGSDPDQETADRLRERLDALFSSMLRALADGQLGFELLLPDGETTIRARTDALASWAGGFLHGLSMTCDTPDLQQRIFRDPLQEIVRDILAISRASEDGRAPQQQSEVALMELTEYIRVALQTAYEEFAVHRAERNGVPRTGY